MCIAIVQQAGNRLREEWLSNSFDSNPDGAGFAYIKEGKVAISKGWMEKQPFMDMYDNLFSKWGKDNPILVHCRIATAGKVSEDNCHPFRIRGGALIHNGHLWSVPGGWNADKSDTREFAETFYNILHYDDVAEAVKNYDMASAIGHDKMAMLYDDGRVATVGHWITEDGHRFSNNGYTSTYRGMACDPWDYDSMYKYAQG